MISTDMQRRVSSRTILDPQFVLKNEQILLEVINIGRFNSDSPLCCVQWSVSHRILTNTQTCDNCQWGMTFGSREVHKFQRNCKHCQKEIRFGLTLLLPKVRSSSINAWKTCKQENISKKQRKKRNVKVVQLMPRNFWGKNSSTG